MNYNNIYQRKIVIWRKVAHLVQALVTLCDQLPTNDIHMLKYRIKDTAVSMTNKIDIGSENINRIDKIRMIIKANSTLAECKDYLTMAEILKYAKTKELVEEVCEVSKLISEDCPSMAIRIN